MISYEDFKKLPNLVTEHDINYDESRKGLFVVRSTLIETMDVCYGPDLNDIAEDQACRELYESLCKMFGS